MKSAIIIGASSGIGRALAKTLSSEGYALGLASRRTNLLNDLAREIPTATFVKTLDVSEPDGAMAALRNLIQEMGDVELFVVNSGTGFVNHDLDWVPERSTIEVNVLGFTAMINVAVRHLEARGAGQLVGISSIAALRGNREAPAYGASKAFISNYLDGLRHKYSKLGLPISVTDVLPGFVDTAMAKGDGKFWVAPPEKAARQIWEAIRKRRKRVYVTRRWRIIAWIIRIMPDWIAHKL